LGLVLDQSAALLKARVQNVRQSKATNPEILVDNAYQSLYLGWSNFFGPGGCLGQQRAQVAQVQGLVEASRLGGLEKLTGALGEGSARHGHKGLLVPLLQEMGVHIHPGA